MDTIDSFQGAHRFLSNFWPCCLEWEGLVYPTLEHAYVSSKLQDPSLKQAIQCCATPGEAKEYLTAHGLAPSIPWTRDKKLQVMEALLFIKFGGRDPLLTRALMATAKAELVEGNTWNDRFWGVCDGAGENNLGRLLMKVRGQLFREKALIEQHMLAATGFDQLAAGAGLSTIQLYEKMMAFGLPTKKYLGY